MANHGYIESQHLLRRDGLHFHDLRGTVCKVLAQADTTPSEIEAMLGWTVSTGAGILNLYQTMTASLSDSTVAKLEASNPDLRNGLSNTPSETRTKGN